MKTILIAVAAVTAGIATIPAQTEDFGAAYSFDERKPQTPVERVIAKVQPSLVKVHGASGIRGITSYATGIIVSKQGHILTLDQILIQQDRTRVVLYDGSVHRAKVLPEDPGLGVRLLKIDPTLVNGELQALWPPDEEGARYRTGQFVVSVGNCFRLAEFSEKLSATFGVVVGKADTALRYRLQDVKYDGELILTDACNNPGHYGGALFTLDGRWLGINARLLDSKETNTMLSAVIPVRDVLPYLEDHILGKRRVEEVVEKVPAWTGMVLFDKAGRRSPPAYVDRVVRGSPAEQLGLRPDDLVVRIDDYSIRSCKEYREVLEKYAAGDSVQLTWKRGTTIKNGELKLARDPKAEEAKK
ncbi:MAG: serine protease [Planctomycetes bacterium]|nr:serine protease [Planctomycetota bacterium]